MTAFVLHQKFRKYNFTNWFVTELIIQLTSPKRRVGEFIINIEIIRFRKVNNIFFSLYIYSFS